jgi:hypothetical protein
VTGMILFTIGVYSMIGLFVAAYITLVHKFDPADRRRDPRR